MLIIMDIRSDDLSRPKIYVFGIITRTLFLNLMCCYTNHNHPPLSLITAVDRNENKSFNIDMKGSNHHIEYDLRVIRNANDSITIRSTDKSKGYKLKTKNFNVGSVNGETYSDSLHNRFTITLPPTTYKVIANFDSNCRFPLLVGQAFKRSSISTHQNEIHVSSERYGISLIDNLKPKKSLRFLNYRSHSRSYDNILYKQEIFFDEEAGIERHIDVFCLEFYGNQRLFALSLFVGSSEDDNTKYIDISDYYVLDNRYEYLEHIILEADSKISRVLGNLSGKTNITSTILSNNYFKIKITYNDEFDIKQVYYYNKINAEGFNNIKADNIIIDIQNLNQDRSVSTTLGVVSSIPDISFKIYKNVLILVVIMFGLFLTLILINVFYRSCRKNNRRETLPNDINGTATNNRRIIDQSETEVLESNNSRNANNKTIPIISERIPLYNESIIKDFKNYENVSNIAISTLVTNREIPDQPIKVYNIVKVYRLDPSKIECLENYASNSEGEPLLPNKYEVN